MDNWDRLEELLTKIGVDEKTNKEFTDLVCDFIDRAREEGYDHGYDVARDIFREG